MPLRSYKPIHLTERMSDMLAVSLSDFWKVNSLLRIIIRVFLK